MHSSARFSPGIWLRWQRDNIIVQHARQHMEFVVTEIWASAGPTIQPCRHHHRSCMAQAPIPVEPVPRQRGQAGRGYGVLGSATRARHSQAQLHDKNLPTPPHMHQPQVAGGDQARPTGVWRGSEVRRYVHCNKPIRTQLQPARDGRSRLSFNSIFGLRTKHHEPTQLQSAF